MQKKIFIKTFGCQMNEYDSNRIYDSVKRIGFIKSQDQDNLDCFVLNTCHIRDKAKEKVYHEIGRVKKLYKEKNKPIVVVAGCVAQAENQEMLNREPYIDIVIGPQSYHKINDKLKNFIKDNKIEETEFDTISKFNYFDNIENKNSKVSSYLTIQEGCDKFCSFCVVPYTRGAEYSRSVNEVIMEAKVLIKNGTKEICLLGQNVNAYHGEYNKKNWNLANLIKEIASLGVKRIRYMTSHPVDMDDDLIKTHGEVCALMPYLHLPVQSGDDGVLKTMNRKYNIEQYINIINRLREVRSDMAFSSDFIIGFPGETEKAFQNTINLIKEVKYAQAYSFKYSRRPGTPGSIMKQQISEVIKTERLKIVQDILNEQQKEFNKSFIGEYLEVLFEKFGRKDCQIVGKSPYLQSVYIDNADFKIGDVANLKIITASKNSMEGKLIKKDQKALN